jgi:rhombotail lipoprotein
MKNKTWIKIGAVAAVFLLVAGCDSLRERQSHHASSLFAYLYPNQSDHVDQPGIPVLSLPLRVGIAFVPEDRPPSRGYWPGVNEAFTEEQRMDLMKKVSTEFKDCPFVSSIEIIPSPYLTPRGGFANLDQIKTMYDVDVMVLLAYDQAQFTDEGFLSLSYWTIVGAYVVNGEKNDTHTMLDAAVYDIASRKLLFRAPGLGDIKGSATPINLGEQLRSDSGRGFAKAATNMTANLQVALDDFRDRVKAAPTEYKIIEKPGYTGAGAFSGTEVAVLGGMGTCWLWKRRTQIK